VDQTRQTARTRRSFLRFLAASPLASLLTLRHGGTPAELFAQEHVRRRPGYPNPGELSAAARHLIASPEEALDVFEFEAVARANLPIAHFGYMQTGVEAGRTAQRNEEAYEEIQLRPRRLVDVSRVDLSMELFGERWASPILIAPCGSQRAFHREGELATARAAKAEGHLQVLSTVTTTSVEDVTEARGAPVWYQLYPTTDWSITEHLLGRAEAAGCPAFVLTVDATAGSDRDPLARWTRLDDRDCERCHAVPYQRKPMFDGLDMRGKGLYNPAMTWDFVRRLRDRTQMRVVLKGIVRGDDAVRAVEEGIDAIVVSNHGGRSEESGRATIDALPEVVDAVGGRIPVLVDGGIRRGNDILKAIATGADAVLIGRAYLWGLGAFGQPGVERVLSMLKSELELAVALAGARNLGELDRSLLVRPGA